MPCAAILAASGLRLSMVMRDAKTMNMNNDIIIQTSSLAAFIEHRCRVSALPSADAAAAL